MNDKEEEPEENKIGDADQNDSHEGFSGPERRLFTRMDDVTEEQWREIREEQEQQENARDARLRRMTKTRVIVRAIAKHRIEITIDTN